MRAVTESPIEYHVEPASPDEISWIAQLEAAMYSPADAVPQAVLEDWYHASPEGFSILKRGEERVGHLDILAPRPKVMHDFLNGDILEREIRGSDLYTSAEREVIQDLYIESVAIALPAARSNAGALKVLLTSFPGLIRRICDPEKVGSLYAIAATESGDRFLRHLGLKTIRNDRPRRDGHSVFVGRWSEIAARTKNHREVGELS